jgi:hypothetical protein
MRYLACLALAGLLPTAAHADCYSDEAQIQATITQVTQRLNSGNVGFCEMGSEVEYAFEQARSFYGRCPVNDPDGSWMRYSNEMIEWGRQMQRNTCTR